MTSVLLYNDNLTPRGKVGPKIGLSAKVPFLKILKIDLLLGVKSNQKNFSSEIIYFIPTNKRWNSIFDK